MGDKYLLLYLCPSVSLSPSCFLFLSISLSHILLLNKICTTDFGICFHLYPNLDRDISQQSNPFTLKSGYSSLYTCINHNPFALMKFKHTMLTELRQKNTSSCVAESIITTTDVQRDYLRFLHSNLPQIAHACQSCFD